MSDAPNSLRGKNFFATTLNVFKETFRQWLEDKAPQLGAALAYYTVFSLAPLILVLLAILGLIFRNDPAGAWEKMTTQLGYFLDRSALDVIRSIAQKASQTDKSIWATIIGVALALFGASGVFGQLQDALNTIWGVKAKPGAGIWGFLRTRFLSFAMVGGVCFLLLVSMTIESLLKAFSHYVQAMLPGGIVVAVAVYLIFDLAIVVLVLAVIFKILPDVKVRWRDVWIGALLTGSSFCFWKMGAGSLSRERFGGFGLWRGQLAHHAASLGLLFVADPAFRRGIHTGLRRLFRSSRPAG